MGWSCGAKASKVLEAWGNKCNTSTRTSNTWEDNGNTYFFEVSRKEHDDGAITGTIFKMVEASPNSPESTRFFCNKVSYFRIEGDGTITRAPKFLKKV